MIYGIEIINNIVDITNYVMIETECLFADTDKIDDNLRSAKKETLITSRNAAYLDEDDIVAADSKNPMTLTTAVMEKRPE